MKIKKTGTKCVVIAAAAVIIAGCETPPKPVAGEGDKVQDVVLVLERESIQDDNFVLYFDENPDKCTFYAKRRAVTLADLANFAMQTCWAKRLSRKFAAGSREQLTDNDIKLAEFCLDTHFMFIDTLSVAVLNDLTQDGDLVKDYKENKSVYRNKIKSDFGQADPKQSKLDSEIDTTYNELKENFLGSKDSPIRNSIREWGSKFMSENVKSNNWKLVYAGIYNQMPRVEIDAIEDNVEDWLWMPEIVKDSQGRKMDTPNQPRNGMATVETSEAWSVMESITRRYLNSLNNIYGAICKRHSDLSLEDRGSFDKSQFLMQKKGRNVNAYNRFFKCAIYDMPLTFYSLRGYAGAYENWHWHGDNEEKMYDAAKYMVMGIRGVEMISNAKSMYSINAYNSTVEFLKDKLSEAEFQTLLTDTKMYHVEINDDASGENKLTQYGANISGK